MIDYPFDSTTAPATRRIYFGWRIVLALFLVTFSIFGTTIYSFIILTKPLAAQSGWSAAQTGGLVSAMWLVAPLALFAGPLAQRVSPWRLIVFGLALEAAALAGMIMVSSFSQLYLLRILMGVAKVITVSAVPLVVSRWFSRRFATAMAIVWAGGSAGGFILSPATEALTEAIGWKPATVVTALGLLGVVVIAGLLARGASSPQALGLDRDGGSAGSATKDGPTPSAQPGRSAGLEARAIPPVTAAFMVLSIIGAGAAAIGVYSQVPTVLEGAGVSPAVAAMLLGFSAGGGLIGSLTIGWMLDRLHPRWSALTTSTLLFGGLLALWLMLHGAGLPLAVFGVLSVGFAFGAGEVLWITFTKRQFGEVAFPLTYGGWYFALQVGYASGGGLAGWSFDRLGAPGFLAFIGLVYLTPAICSLVIRAGRQAAPSAAH